MKIVHFIFSCIVLFFTVSFAVSNKQIFPLTLWPFPFEINLPVSFIVLVFALLFFIFGGFYSWLLSVPVRNERYTQAKKIKELTQKIAELEAKKEE
ncbi:MAG: LapA family protein [Alphaproteobacteria bacterium]|nr:LapA family protein [Alphaproteobacteria bacterium]MBO4643696.1 LapA family protein [Alphaproteobacteria bacterium]